MRIAIVLAIIAILSVTVAFTIPTPAASVEANIDYRVLADHPIISPKHRADISAFAYNGGRLSFPVKALTLGVSKGTSMMPMSGDQSTLIMTRAFNVDDLKVGDVVGVEIPVFGKYAHQIIGIEHDATGRYFLTKGINNVDADWWPVRDADIKYLVLGVIW